MLNKIKIIGKILLNDEKDENEKKDVEILTDSQASGNDEEQAQPKTETEKEKREP